MSGRVRMLATARAGSTPRTASRDGATKSGWIRLAADQEGGGKRRRHLKHGEIVFALDRVAGKVGMLDVADDADDSRPRCAPSLADVFADRTLVGPVLARQRFVDDGDRLGVGLILSSEGASAAELDLQRGEIVRRDEAQIAVRTGIARSGRAVFNGERCGAGVSAEGDWNTLGNCGHARKIRQALQDRAVEGDALGRFAVLRLRQRHASGDHATWLKAGGHFF